MESAIVEFVKRNNEKIGFVPQTIKQIGYPRWNKMKVFENTMAPKNKANTSFTEENETDTSTVVYVPFVKPGRERVNSVLMFKMNRADTAFQYVSNWQYSSFSFTDTSSASWSAPDILHIFMMMDHEVFGYDEFQVMDGRLLGNANAVGTLHLYPDSSADRSGQSLTEVVASFTFCNWVSSCICVGTLQNGEQQQLIEEDPSSSSLPCNGPCSYTAFCTTIWIDLGAGGAGGGGGTGGTGGPTGGSGGSGGTGGQGGTGTGGWTPPACSRCNVGWTPGGGGASSINPCDKVNPLLTDLKFQAKVANSQGLLTGDQEYAFSITSGGENYHSDLGIAGECEVKSPFNANTPELRVYGHMHTNSCPLPIFSPEDLSQLDQIISLDAASSNFVYALVTDSGVYFIVIDNPTAFEYFASQWLRDDSPKDLYDLNDNYIEYNINRQNSAAENEKQFLQFLKEQSPGTSSGLKLLKANADLSDLKQLSIDENNQLIRTPCN